jgi:predicted nucleic acid-binding protein
MQVFDASSMIYAWDNYPAQQFPGLWEWMAEQISRKELVISGVAFEEVLRKAPDCGEWLKTQSIKRLAISNAILKDAFRIKELLGIADDQYHPKGVGENDILIIATARAHQAELVSDERRQTGLPQAPSKRKIPAVCAMTEVDVPCINFIDFIRRTGQVFR